MDLQIEKYIQFKFWKRKTTLCTVVCLRSSR